MSGRLLDHSGNEKLVGTSPMVNTASPEVTSWTVKSATGNVENGFGSILLDYDRDHIDARPADIFSMHGGSKMLKSKTLIVSTCLLAVGFAAGIVFAQSGSHSGGHDHTAAVGSDAPKEQGQWRQQPQ